jgi:transposase
VLGQEQGYPRASDGVTETMFPNLKAAPGIAAISVSRSRSRYCSAKYHRIGARRGQIRALVAVQHSMLLAIWHILTTGEVYCDPPDA